MKKLLAAMWLPVMGLCTSCDKEVTVENVAENGKLVVYCIPSNVKDTTFYPVVVEPFVEWRNAGRPDD